MRGDELLETPPMDSAFKYSAPNVGIHCLESYRYISRSRVLHAGRDAFQTACNAERRVIHIRSPVSFKWK